MMIACGATAASARGRFFLAHSSIVEQRYTDRMFDQADKARFTPEGSITTSFDIAGNSRPGAAGVQSLPLWK